MLSIVISTIKDNNVALSKIVFHERKGERTNLIVNTFSVSIPVFLIFDKQGHDRHYKIYDCPAILAFLSISISPVEVGNGIRV